MKFLRNLFTTPHVLLIHAVCISSIVLAFLSILLSSPTIREISYFVNGTKHEIAHFPFLINSKEIKDDLAEANNEIEIHFTLALPRLSPISYSLIPDDCITSITINNVLFRDSRIPFCKLKGETFNFGPLLKRGNNNVTVRIQDRGGKIGFVPLHLPTLLTSFIPILLLVFYALFLVTRLRLKKITEYVSYIFISGSVLRYTYMLVTPYHVRSYDWAGHLEYVQYILNNWKIPPSQGGWQFYQPPLYYFLSAIWNTVTNFLKVGTEVLIGNLQILSLLLSLATLAICLIIGFKLFDSKKQPSLLILYSLLITFFPSIFFFSSRITNDALYLLISSAIVLFILRWWESGKKKDWIITIILICAGLLTKSNSIPFLGIAWILLVFHKNLTQAEKMDYLAHSVILVIILTGWFYLLRFGIQGEKFIVGNRLNGRLGIGNAISHYVTFNPLQVLLHPFNDNWGDGERRMFFLEYVFRSMFFGEFNFGSTIRPLAVSILATAMACIPLTIVGIWKSVRSSLNKSLPLLLILIIFLAAAIWYRFKSPFSPNQDFRFIPITVIPIIYFLLHSLRTLPHFARATTSLLVSLFSFELIALLVLLITKKP